MEELLQVARQISQRAYCPYSRFAVGAALLGASGKMYAGCNVENASYGLTICAERVAIGRAIAEGEKEIRAVAIYTPTAVPTAPCGACRQVLSEFGLDATVICSCDGSELLMTTVRELLPNSFGTKDLKRNA